MVDFQSNLGSEFNIGVSKIKSLEIQGAENIAKYSLNLLKNLVKKNKDNNKLFSIVSDAKMALFKSRPTEPAMRNAINYVLLNGDVSIHPIDIIKRIDQTISFFEKSEQFMIDAGSKRIKKGFVVYTHCHSSSVVNILKKAKDLKINFEVHNTETRPLYQGRKTAKELAEYGIPVTHFVDSAARLALKKSDIMLIGCDAISESKIYNKIGSELFVEVANRYDIPVYVCTHSWKFDPVTITGYEEVVEERSPNEVWEDAPKGVNVLNPAFEKIDINSVTAIICELGIFSPNAFFQEIKSKYRWMR